MHGKARWHTTVVAHDTLCRLKDRKRAVPSPKGASVAWSWRPLRIIPCHSGKGLHQKGIKCHTVLDTRSVAGKIASSPSVLLSMACFREPFLGLCLFRHLARLTARSKLPTEFPVHFTGSFREGLLLYVTVIRISPCGLTECLGTALMHCGSN